MNVVRGEVDRVGNGISGCTGVGYVILCVNQNNAFKNSINFSSSTCNNGPGVSTRLEMLYGNGNLKPWYEIGMEPMNAARGETRDKDWKRRSLYLTLYSREV